jgi:hypothetical protein
MARPNEMKVFFFFLYFNITTFGLGRESVSLFTEFILVIAVYSYCNWSRKLRWAGYVAVWEERKGVYRVSGET